jgi:hypothetical protein
MVKQLDELVKALDQWHRARKRGTPRRLRKRSARQPSTTSGALTVSWTTGKVPVAAGTRTRPGGRLTRLRTLLRWLCLCAASFAAASLCVRIPLAILRTDHLAGFVRVVLFNPTVLGGLFAWTLYAALPPYNHKERWAFLLPPIALPWLLAAVLALAGPAPLARFGLPAPYLHEASGTLGFAPHTCYRDRRGVAPMVHLCTNAEGLRGPERFVAPRVGSPRVAIVGDSFVFGSGVAEGGSIDAALTRTLGRSFPTVQVVNVGFPGLSFASYVRMLRQVVPVFRPDVVILGFNKGNDLDPADPWERQLAYGPAMFVLSAVLLVEPDLYAAEQQGETTWIDESKVPASIRQRFEAELRDLRELQAQAGFAVLVFSYYGETTMFSQVRDPRFRVTRPTNQGWEEDPRLHIEHDGHPTAPGNVAFAEQMAADITPWLATRKPASQPGQSAPSGQ